MFETPMELHCSQTFPRWLARRGLFETPMELHCSQTKARTAKHPSRFETPMELHCSQTYLVGCACVRSLRPLWNYTALKLFRALDFDDIGLRPLWNYTALKRRNILSSIFASLRPLWNYTALKPQISNSESKSRKQPAIVWDEVKRGRKTLSR